MFSHGGSSLGVSRSRASTPTSLSGISSNAVQQPAPEVTSPISTSSTPPPPPNYNHAPSSSNAGLMQRNQQQQPRPAQQMRQYQHPVNQQRQQPAPPSSGQQFPLNNKQFLPPGSSNNSVASRRSVTSLGMQSKQSVQPSVMSQQSQGQRSQTRSINKKIDIYSLKKFPNNASTVKALKQCQYQYEEQLQELIRNCEEKGQTRQSDYKECELLAQHLNRLSSRYKKLTCVTIEALFELSNEIRDEEKKHEAYVKKIETIQHEDLPQIRDEMNDMRNLIGIMSDLIHRKQNHLPIDLHDLDGHSTSKDHDGNHDAVHGGMKYPAPHQEDGDDFQPYDPESHNMVLQSPSNPGYILGGKVIDINDGGNPNFGFYSSHSPAALQSPPPFH